jgi:hypothetical protein
MQSEKLKEQILSKPEIFNKLLISQPYFPCIQEVLSFLQKEIDSLVGKRHNLKVFHKLYIKDYNYNRNLRDGYHLSLEKIKNEILKRRKLFYKFIKPNYELY